MSLLISLALASLLAVLGRQALRRHGVVCYVIAGALAVFTVAAVESGLPEHLPGWAHGALSLLTHGSLAGALFILVMFAGAVPNGSRAAKALMPVRGPLSILACILTLGHNGAYGRHYFSRLLAGDLPLPTRLAALCSLAMLLIMLPLFVTSFPCVRRRMPYRRWKRLQRWAYGFYGLMFLHVLLIQGPSARMGSLTARLNQGIYSALFVAYAVLRMGKALKKRHSRLARRLPLCGAMTLALMWMGMCGGGNGQPAAQPLPLQDGVYTGAGIGYNGRMTAAVTIENGAITAVRVTGNVEDEPYMTDAANGLIPAILAAQSADVDIVTGATSSSAGLRDAVNAALNKAQNTETP